MTGREVAKSYSTARSKIRAKAARLTPKVLTHYPFEVLAAVIATLMGLPFLLGTAAPATLVGLVGIVAFHAWAAALALGGLTVAVGLRIGDQPNPLVVASGLQLLGGCFLVYALAAFIALGLMALTAVAAYVCLGGLAWIRATHFRRIVDIQRGARRLKGSG